MELFYENGHLKETALKQLEAGALDELARLEVAEHLSYCDECLLSYTQMLTDDVLMTPTTSVSSSVLQRIKQRARLLFFNRFTTVAACACLAAGLWFSGVFQAIAPKDSRDTDPILQGIHEKTSVITQTTGGWANQRLEDIQNLFSLNGRSTQP